MSTVAYKRMTEREYRNYQRKIHRQRELHRKYLLAVLSVALVLICAITFKSFTSKAVEETDVTYKYFKSFEVSNGDTLWSIAKEYIDYSYYDDINEYIEEVVSINHLEDDTIMYGQCIVIPYFSNEYH